MRLALLATLALTACATPPPSQPVVFDGSATARLGQTVRIGDVAIRPLEILDDSRCPADVQCVQAGFFRVRVNITTAHEDRTEIMQLGRGLALEDARSLRLTGVEPTRGGGPPPLPGTYRMTFTLGPGD